MKCIIVKYTPANTMKINSRYTYVLSKSQSVLCITYFTDSIFILCIIHLDINFFPPNFRQTAFHHYHCVFVLQYVYEYVIRFYLYVSRDNVHVRGSDV